MTKTLLKLVLVAGALVTTLPADAAVFHHRTGVFLGASFRPWGWGWYGPYYGPYYGAYPMAVYPNAGQLKIDTKVKDAQVYINGAYAGTVKEMKSMWLRQGRYQLEVRAPGGEKYDSQIYMVDGRTLHVHPNLRAGGNS